MQNQYQQKEMHHSCKKSWFKSHVHGQVFLLGGYFSIRGVWWKLTVDALTPQLLLSVFVLISKEMPNQYQEEMHRRNKDYVSIKIIDSNLMSADAPVAAKCFLHYSVIRGFWWKSTTMKLSPSCQYQLSVDIKENAERNTSKPDNSREGQSWGHNLIIVFWWKPPAQCNCT